MTAQARRMGVPVAAGTDHDVEQIGGSPVLFTELEALVDRSGFSPLEAITAATLNGARLLGTERRSGTIERGKIADLVVVRADPFKDIRNLRQVVYVVKEGQVHRSGRGPQ